MAGPQKRFMDDLAEIYSAEHRLIKILPQMAKYAQSAELKNAINENVEQTKRQFRRLDELFDTMGKSRDRKTSVGMKKEGHEVAKQLQTDSVLDATFWI